MAGGRKIVSRFMAVALSGLCWLGSAIADEAPISGIVKFVDLAAQTLTLESAEL
jgi:hypothetical protein